MSGWLTSSIYTEDVPPQDNAPRRSRRFARLVGRRDRQAGMDRSGEVRKTFVGTPNWMAPEVLEIKDKGYDSKADIWSLGITAIELATGRAPNADMDPLQVMVRTLDQPPPSLDSIRKDLESRGQAVTKDEGFKQFVKRCLQKDPEKRPTAQQLLSFDFLSKHSKGEQYLRDQLTWTLPSVAKINRPVTNVKPKRIESGRFVLSSWDFSEREVPGVGKPEKHVSNLPPSAEVAMSEAVASPPLALPDAPAAPPHPGKIVPVKPSLSEAAPANPEAPLAASPVLPVAPPPAVPALPAAATVVPKVFDMALRMRDASDVLQDINFELNAATDSPKAIAEELVEAKLITVHDCGQVTKYMTRLLKNPTATAITFPLHDIASELEDGDEGTIPQEKPKLGYAQVILNAVDGIKQPKPAVPAPVPVPAANAPAAVVAAAPASAPVTAVPTSAPAVAAAPAVLAAAPAAVAAAPDAVAAAPAVVAAPAVAAVPAVAVAPAVVAAPASGPTALAAPAQAPGGGDTAAVAAAAAMAPAPRAPTTL